MRRFTMPTVARIIEAHGGLEHLCKRPIRLLNPPYMRLVIEAIGDGPRGLPAISVAHYYEQNGDLMRDPEMVFEIGPDGWAPVSFWQDNLGFYQEAVVLTGGKVFVRQDIVADLKTFARDWDRNIAAQGFLDCPLS